uniref:Uncharacterized protein n=1 Tax=Anopheles darlingi TaxID=43151 RepID=A0A2M4DIF7_ANODA
MAFLVLSISAFSSFSHFLAFLSSSFTANFRLNMCFSIAEADISFPVLTVVITLCTIKNLHSQPGNTVDRKIIIKLRKFGRG